MTAAGLRRWRITSPPADGQATHLSVFGNSYAKDADVTGPTNVYARVDGGASTPLPCRDHPVP